MLYSKLKSIDFDSFISYLHFVVVLFWDGYNQHIVYVMRTRQQVVIVHFTIDTNHPFGEVT